ncbi:MAG: GNAT family N-acetyltransferase [Pseudomonadota bacterium]
MQEPDPNELAKLHAEAFKKHGRAWSASEFGRLLAQKQVFCCADAVSFAIGRVIADEAELLTLATEPLQQRKGLGLKRLAEFENEAKARGARSAFLEVAENNRSAISLYERCVYIVKGRRNGYYLTPVGQRINALVMEKQL